MKPEFRTSASAYFAVAFAWSLAFWLLTVLLGGIGAFPGSVLQYAGGAGPFVAALVLVHAFESRAVVVDFWVRTFDPRRIPATWLLVALLLHPLIILLATVADVLLGGEVVFKTASLTGVGAVLSLVFFVFVFGPLPEEMGWRGVALDRLQARMSPLSAGLILGVAWAAWHVPLFLIDGTFQHQLGFGSFRFWVFMADLLPLTIIIHWVYNHTNRSTLSAALLHFSGNICGALLVKSDRLAGLELVVLVVVAGLILAREGSRLGYRD